MNRDKFENTINDISSMSGRLHDASIHYRLNEMHEASENVENMTDDLLAEFDRLTARIAELEAGNRWIPVGERLPDIGKVVEVVFENRFSYFPETEAHFIRMAFSARYDDGTPCWKAQEKDFVYGGKAMFWRYVSFVIPLPAAPEAQQ
jgi:hypothetical protein